MFSSEPVRRFALVYAYLFFAAVLLIAVTAARADNITYNIVNYPVNQEDTIFGGTDTISGTIITDGTTGVWTESHVVGGTLTLESLGGTYTYPLLYTGSNTYTFLEATSQKLLLPEDHDVFFDSLPDNNGASGVTDVYVGYYRGGGIFPDNYVGFVKPEDGPQTARWYDDDPPASCGSIGRHDPWVIATAVPEPASLTLLASALLGLGAFYLRRRRAA